MLLEQCFGTFEKVDLVKALYGLHSNITKNKLHNKITTATKNKTSNQLKCTNSTRTIIKQSFVICTVILFSQVQCKYVNTLYIMIYV